MSATIDSFVEQATVAVPIEEITTRYICGVCGILIPAKGLLETTCKNGHFNKIVRL